MSDHFSGPRAMAGPAADITDMWAFPSPERPGHLVLAVGMQPAAMPGAHFSDEVLTRIRLRPLEIAGAGAKRCFPFAPESEELVVELGFSAPRPTGSNGTRVQEGWCRVPSGETLDFTVGDEQRAEGDAVRVYAGYRADPFFFDVPAWFQSVEAGRLLFQEQGTNILDGLNLMAIVVELDTAMLAGGPLFGVASETVAAGPLPIRIDRFGRPEIKNVMLNQQGFDKVNATIELRDLYNLEDAFHMSGDYRPVYATRLNANLAAFDQLDGETGWQLGPDGEHPLTELLLDDYMVVDVSKPLATDSFFEIESAVLQGRAHETCGGRWLDDDVMDTIFTFMVSGVPGTHVSDGVDAPWKAAAMAFPYFASPNPNPPAIAEVVAGLGAQDA
jgi:Domain of unknown function (DUF4331)